MDGSGIFMNSNHRPGHHHKRAGSNVQAARGRASDSLGNQADANVSNVVEGYIYTVAGTGAAGYSGDGGPATSAQLNNPSDVALDASGNLYIADYENSVIRKVDHNTGYIYTVAGTGAAGYSGDGGPATSAQLNHPNGVALDAPGNLYIADQYNNIIRQVDHNTGAISTVAGNYKKGAGYSGDGGPATSAQLYNPNGVALDASGNLYISDSSNCVIRFVDYATGIISTVAGSYALGPGYSGDGGPAINAQLFYPYGVALDAFSNIFIGDTSNSVIRFVDYATGIISTVAGSYALGPGYSGDGGPATGAQMYWPNGVALDAFSNIFIGDTSNSVIRYVDQATGIISTVAGNHALGPGYSGDGGPATGAQMDTPVVVALDALGNLYIGDQGNNVIRQVASATTYTVIYNGNGNTSGEAPADPNSPYNSGATVTVLGNTGQLVKTGYSFAGWNTAADGSGTTYQPNDTFAITADVVLYALWMAVSPLSVAPTSYDFGSVAVGQKSQIQSFVVTNNSKSSLSILSVQISGTNATEFFIAADPCTGSSLAPGSSCAITVYFAPASSGAKSATLSIKSNSVSPPLIVPLAGTATQPQISIVPTAFDFGRVVVGRASQPETFVLTNNGSTSVTIDSALITGADASDFRITDDPTGKCLQPGMSCPVCVRMFPRMVQHYSASMVITADPVLIVPLSGEGVLDPPTAKDCILVNKVYDQCFAEELVSSQASVDSVCLGITIPPGATVGCIPVPGSATCTFAGTVAVTPPLTPFFEEVLAINSFEASAPIFVAGVMVCEPVLTLTGAARADLWAPPGTTVTCDILSFGDCTCTLLASPTGLPVALACTGKICKELQVTAPVKLLLPSYGFCEIPACTFLPQPGFACLPTPLFPPQRCQDIPLVVLLGIGGIPALGTTVFINRAGTVVATGATDITGTVLFPAIGGLEGAIDTVSFTFLGKTVLFPVPLEFTDAAGVAHDSATTCSLVFTQTGTDISGLPIFTVAINGFLMG
jgi:uncharacterized repeat protein (TIGR02543 family)